MKIDVSKLKEEKVYSNKLLEQSKVLKKASNYKIINTEYNTDFLNKNLKKEDFLVSYIIIISFLKANTTLTVSDIKGNLKMFYSSGSVDLAGKQKKNRIKAISRLISLLFKKATFIKNYPVAVHLHNVTSHKLLIINKLKKQFFIRIIKSYNQAPYNGCRKKKMRRKKYVKNFK